MNLTTEQRKKYRDPKGKRCACSRPAVKWVSGEFTCEFCLKKGKSIYRRHDSERGYYARREVNTVPRRSEGGEG